MAFDIMNFIKPISVFLTALIFSPSQAATTNINTYFDQIKHDPNALYTFFKAMPKGGELHYHLAGGSSPETMLNLIKNNDYCLDKNTLAVTKSEQCTSINVKDISNEPSLYDAIVRDWSMKDFIAGTESGHDHFFKGFIKYMPIVLNNRPALLADIITRAAEQHELYLEVLDIPDNAQSINFGALLNNTASFDEKRKKLLANNAFQKNIDQTITATNTMLQDARQQLQCAVTPQSAACKIKVKVLYYVLREQPINNVFAQALNAFAAAARSNGTLVGVNLVQPEDGIISLQDYHQQMQVFGYMHQRYPQVPISLHAGELSADSASFSDLAFHIHDAIFTANAQRIGHGIDIAYENNATATLDYMAKHQLPVEVNLISNLKILNISGKNHPLKLYLAHHVPVVFSTDDEGVLRTDLTRQYVAGVLDQSLDYKTLKLINRNALTYAFMQGKSIWANTEMGEFVPECQELNSNSCKDFIKHSEKAQLQWELEQRLLQFEQSFDHKGSISR